MRRFARIGVGLWAALAASSSVAHGRSQSFLEGRVRDQRLELTIRLATHDLLSARPAWDGDGDGGLRPRELAGVAGQIGSEVARGVQVGLQDGAACAADPARVQGVGAPVEEVQVDLTVRCPRSIEGLVVKVGLLADLAPPHVTVATFTGPGLDASHVFTPAAPVARLRVPRGAASSGAGWLWIAAGLFAAVSAGVLVGRFLARSGAP